MSDPAQQLAKLKEMYAKGVLTLEQGGEKVTFASGPELRRRIADLQAQVDQQAGGPKRSRVHYPTFDKGL